MLCCRGCSTETILWAWPYRPPHLFILLLNLVSDFQSFLNFLGRPLDLSSLLSSSNGAIPFSYFILLTSTVISVGVSFARILTKGKHPVLKNIISFKFFKVILMLILKLMIQSYFLSMAFKSLMYKFVSKGRNLS